MDFTEYVSSLGLDPADLTPERKLKLQAAWRAQDNVTKLAELRASRSDIPFVYSSSADRGAPGGAALLEAGLLSHLGVRTQRIAQFFGEQTADAITRRENRVTGIQHVMRTFMQANGHHGPSGKFTDSDIADAFRLDRSIPMSIGPSTGIQLSGILSNVANKSLLAAFEDTPVTWRLWAKTGSVNDFKTATRYRMTGDGEFVQIAPGGQISHVGLTEASATAKALTYGALLGIDRTDIINDDLSAFASVPKVLSRMAAMKIEKLATAKLLENTGGTTSGFFSTTHVNYASGAGSALQESSLVTAYQKFVEMADDNGDPTLIVPRILAVPPALEMTARKLVTSTEMIGSTTANALMPNGNPWAGKFEVVVIPFLADVYGLTNSSDTGWYLLSAPGDFSCVEAVFLDGKVAPTVETAEMDFDRLGVAMRAFSDVGVNTLEYRGGVLSAGA